MGKGNGCCGKGDDEKSSDKSKFKSSTDGTGENAILAVSRCLTDPHMLLVFICFLCASAALLYTAYNQGEIERIKYGDCPPSCLGFHHAACRPCSAAIIQPLTGHPKGILSML